MGLTTTEGQTGLPRYFRDVFRLAQTAKRGRLDIILPDGRRFRAQGAEPGYVAEFTVHNDDLFARLIREGDLGFCEAYMDGWWSTPDLMAFLDFVHDGNDDIYDGFPGQTFVRAYERMRHWMKSNTKRQAKKNISAHYDLGNAFYGEWLDDTMTYSSALFETGQESLEAAQIAKYRQMVDEMGALPGDHVLEIGCGWGGFAEYAAGQRGLRVTALTISQEQHDYAVQRIADAGLADRVEIKMQDYREEVGQYDGIASIEMFEAVGERYWPVYFETLKRCLKPGGNATLQIITLQHRRWMIYRNGVDFIQKYIFPGGMLPSDPVLDQHITESGLSLKNHVYFGQSYSQTLRRWHERFNEKWAKIAPMGFDDRFRRMWDFYLCSCAATFRSKNCDVVQVTVTRG